MFILGLTSTVPKNSKKNLVAMFHHRYYNTEHGLAMFNTGAYNKM